MIRLQPHLQAECNAESSSAEFATAYKVHVLNSDGTAAQSGGTTLVASVPSTTNGTGAHSYTVQPSELGNPTGAATFRFQVRLPLE